MSNRPIDHQQEKYVTEFVNKYFFSKLSKNVIVVDDNDLQLSGVDMIINDKYYDLKAQTNYINDPRPTFILELLFFSKQGEKRCGWFMNESLKTNYYVFIWIPNARTNQYGRLTSAEDIEEAEIMIIDRQKLHDYIFSIISLEDMRKTVTELLHTGERYKNVIDGVKYCYSTQLDERPICLVVSKELLKTTAVYHYIVRKNYL